MKKTLFALILSTAAMAASAHAVIPTNGLIAYYKFKNMSSNDLSQSGNNLIFVSPSFTSDRFGNSNSALALNYTNGAISSKNVGITGNSDRTISVWVLVSEEPTYPDGQFLGWGTNNAQYSIQRIDYLPYVNDGNIRSDGLNCNAQAKASIGSLVGRWHQITYTYTHTNYTPAIYIDGIAQTNTTHDLMSNLNTQDSPLYINTLSIPSALLGGYRGWGIKGAIDDVRIYNRPLSSNEVKSLYTQDLPSVNVYTVSGKSYAYASTNKTTNSVGGFFLADNSGYRTAFIWQQSNSPSKTYNIEYHNDIDTQITGTNVGAFTLYSSVATNGAFPNVEKDIIWLKGINATVSLNNSNKVVTPSSITGFINTLSLQSNTVIQEMSPTFSLSSSNTLKALTNHETLDATISRLTNNLGNQGFIPVP